MRRSAFAATVAVLTFIVSLAIPALVLNRVAYAAHGGPHATITTWAVGANPTIGGFNPHETIDDVDGVTSHVGSPAMVTSMENTQFGFCGLLFWNPTTNSFKSYAVTGGFQFALDLNRGTPAPAGSPTGTFGGGDVWATVNGNPGFSPYMNFRGSNNFRRWNIGNTGATGIRVNSANGKAYLGNFPAGQLIELDPATNAVRTWTTGSKPYNLFFDGTSVWATGVANAGAGQPDQVLFPERVLRQRRQIAGGGEDPQAAQRLGPRAVRDQLQPDEEPVGWLGAHAGDDHLDGGVDLGADEHPGSRLEPGGVLGEGPHDHVASQAVRLEDLPDEEPALRRVGPLGPRRPCGPFGGQVRQERLSRRFRRGRCGPPWRRRP